MIWFLAPVLFALFWKDHPAFCFFLIFVLIVFSGGKGSKLIPDDTETKDKVKNKEQ